MIALSILAILALLVMVGIFGFYLVRKAFFYLKWRNKRKHSKELEKNRDIIMKGNMLDDSAFKKATSKKDTFLDTNTIQRQKDVNYAYQNISYRNELVEDFYAGTKAINKYSEQKTIFTVKNPETSTKYPSKPEDDVNKNKISTRRSKVYMQEHNINYTYTKRMSIFEMILWILVPIIAVVGFSVNFENGWAGIALIPFVIALILWGLRFMNFGLKLSTKNREKLSSAIMNDIKAIERLDDFMDGFLKRNSNITEDLTAALKE